MADPAFAVGNPIAFGLPCSNYKRHILAQSFSQGIEVGRSTEFGLKCTNYKRHLLTPAATMEVLHRVSFGTRVVRRPRPHKIFSPSVLIDVRLGQFLLGDTGAEIIYNLPNRLRIRPRLIAPSSGSQHRTGEPVMIWTPTVEAAYYEVHVARDVEFLDRVARFEVIGSEIQRGFAFGGTYYWKVRAVAGTAWSDYSEVWSFTVPAILPGQEGAHDGDGRARLLTQFRAEA